MEVLSDSVCILCEEKTSVLTPQCVAPYVKYLHTTFFEKNNDALQEFQKKLSDRGLCALCSHQAVISHKFKDSYEDICKKSSVYKKTRTGCFLCEQKVVDLIGTETNPNNFSTKISAFMESSLFPRPSSDCMVCFDCIFYLNVWYIMYCYLQKQCHIKLTETASNPLASPSTRTKAQKKVHFNEDATVIEINGTEKIMEKHDSPTKRRSPPPSSKPSSLKKKPGPLSTKNKNKPGPLSAKNKRKLGPLSAKNKRKSRSVKNHIGPKRNKTALKRLLKKQLQHLRTVKQVNNRKKWSADILQNQKMFVGIPYVLLCRESLKQGNVFDLERDGSKSPDLIEISDSEDECSEIKPMPAIKKASFKIKMSANFLASPKTHKGKKKPKTGPVDYTCDVCDKQVASLSEYKMHALWHEKPERPIVNVTRSNFVKDTISSDMNNQESEESKETETVEDDLEKNSSTVENTNEPAMSDESTENSMNKKLGLCDEVSEGTQKDAVESVGTDGEEDEEERGENKNDDKNSISETKDESAIEEEEEETNKNESKADDKDKSDLQDEETMVEQQQEETGDDDDKNSAVDENEAQNTNVKENNIEETEVLEDTNDVDKVDHNNKSSDFSTDSESNDTAIKNPIDTLSKNNGEVDSDTDEDDSATQIDDSLNKKRNHDERLIDDDHSVIKNGNDDGDHKSKRTKFSTDGTEIAENTDKSEQKAVEGVVVMDDIDKNQ